MYGTSGNDVLTGTAGADVICGLAGNDTISPLGRHGPGPRWQRILHGLYATATAAVSADLDTDATPAYVGGDAGLTLYAIENATGSPYDDTLIGSAQANILDGTAGMMCSMPRAAATR